MNKLIPKLQDGNQIGVSVEQLLNRPRRVNFEKFASNLSNNRGRAINVKHAEQILDSLIDRGWNLPLRLAVLATFAQETDKNGLNSVGVGGNGMLGLSSGRMPIRLLKKGLEGNLIKYVLNDMTTIHPNNWNNGGSGGISIMNAKDGFNKFWNSKDIAEATQILNKSYIRPRDREASWNNRINVAKTMEKYLE